MDEIVCSRFEPQKWRKRKCKNCFQDRNNHVSNEKDEYSNIELDNESNCVPGCKQKQLCFALKNEHKKIVTTGINLPENSENSRISISKEVSEVKEIVVKTRKEELRRDENDDFVQGVTEGFDSGLGKNDGLDLTTSRTASCETTGLLSRFATIEFSSTSSLASFDFLEDTSSYSYTGSRENLDTSGDELSFGETIFKKNLVTDAENTISVLEEEIDNLRENQKSIERNKDRQIQTLDRELQNLKLELTKYSARENMTILTKRLEIEGKNSRIEELENEIQSLESTINNLNQSKSSEEFQNHALEEDLKRRKCKIQSLEDEKRTLEERLSLAEDLQQNDRELLEVLGKQLEGLEKDLLSSEDRNKNLEEKVKILGAVESDLAEERANSQKLNKQIDFLNGKLKLREQHVSYLEDDNVNLQQQNQNFESKLRKSATMISKLNNTIKDLEKDIDIYNKEIEHLYAENSELEHEHWQAIIEQADASGEVQNYIQDLEKRVSRTELKLRDVEFENEAMLKESSKILDELVDVKNEYEESQKQLESVTEKFNHTQQVKCDQDKRMIVIQRKLKKLQKEKKRYNLGKVELESKISDLKSTNSKISVKSEEIEKGYKMIQLKLQSTEAKMAMLEGNKTYLESKIDEYEKKYKSNNDRLISLNHLINEYSQSKSNHVDELNFDLLESSLKKILAENLKKVNNERLHKDISNSKETSEDLNDSKPVVKEKQTDYSKVPELSKVRRWLGSPRTNEVPTESVWKHHFKSINEENAIVGTNISLRSNRMLDSIKQNEKSPGSTCHKKNNNGSENDSEETNFSVISENGQRHKDATGNGSDSNGTKHGCTETPKNAYNNCDQEYHFKSSSPGAISVDGQLLKTCKVEIFSDGIDKIGRATDCSINNNFILEKPSQEMNVPNDYGIKTSLANAEKPFNTDENMKSQSTNQQTDTADKIGFEGTNGKNYEEICDYFKNSVKTLKQQNEILESKLDEVSKLKTVLNSIDSNATHAPSISSNGGLSTRFVEKPSIACFKPFEKVKLVLDLESAADKSNVESARSSVVKTNLRASIRNNIEDRFKNSTLKDSLPGNDFDLRKIDDFMMGEFISKRERKERHEKESKGSANTEEFTADATMCNSNRNDHLLGWEKQFQSSSDDLSCSRVDQAVDSIEMFVGKMVDDTFNFCGIMKEIKTNDNSSSAQVSEKQERKCKMIKHADMESKRSPAKNLDSFLVSQESSGAITLTFPSSTFEEGKPDSDGDVKVIPSFHVNKDLKQASFPADSL